MSTSCLPLLKRELSSDWQLFSSDGKITLPARVPATVLELLVENGVVPDPFIGLHESACAPYFQQRWEFRREVAFQEEELVRENVQLVFHGLDTLCTVFWNGEEVLRTENMHRTFHLMLKGPGRNLLQPGKNLLQLFFDPAPVEARRRIVELGLSPTNEKAFLPFALPGVETLRKAYYSFGWDWGPILPDAGIWRNVEVHSYDVPPLPPFSVKTSLDPEWLEKMRTHPKLSRETEGTLKEANVAVSFAESPSTPEVAAFFCALREKGLALEAQLSFQGETIAASSLDLSSTPKQVCLRVPQPKLWWTHDLGAPKLYRLQLRVLSPQDGAIVEEKEVATGLRSIRLVRNPDAWGESFFFELNGLALFARGANWVPSDSFLARGERNNLPEKRLLDAKNAHFNMVRVWGGGVYESDHFYDVCDREGLLVWQDFAFACRPTPNREAFREEVWEEATQNVLRLRNHPSLAIWVGNNEIEEGWVHWGFEKLVPGLKEFYLQLFEKDLPQVVAQLDGERAYWPSSPSSGGGFQDPQSENFGDSHFWKVWHDGYPFSSFREFPSRFMSEFGFESFPGMQTIAAFCPPEQWDMFSPVMENHQKNPAGNAKILEYMKKRFSIPCSFADLVVVSQLTQAEAIEYGVEFWRSNRNANHCMGALFWQLNDCWPVASWSSIDFYGQWKALQYFAKRFFHPLLVCLQVEEGELRFLGCNDTRDRFAGVFHIQAQDAAGKVLFQHAEEVHLDPLHVTPLRELSRNSEWLKGRENNVAFAFWLEKPGGEMVFRGMKMLAKPAEFPLQDPRIHLEVQNTSSGASITVGASRPAFHVFLQSEAEGRFEDQFFSLLAGETKTIAFQGKNPPAGFRARSLYDLLLRSSR